MVLLHLQMVKLNVLLNSIGLMQLTHIMAQNGRLVRLKNKQVYCNKGHAILGLYGIFHIYSINKVFL